MANSDHISLLKESIETSKKRSFSLWNEWREDNPDIQPDLSSARITESFLANVPIKPRIRRVRVRRVRLVRKSEQGVNLNKINFSGVNLENATLNLADLGEADLSGANLKGARLFLSNLTMANLSGADLTGANLTGARLIKTNCSRVSLEGASLRNAQLIETNLSGANLTGSHIHGISVWDVELQNSIQLNLQITPPDQPNITVDNLEIAQFMYLLINDRKLREVIDTITSKLILILGRFKQDRMCILEDIRDFLRNFNYIPILFTFGKSDYRNMTETISWIAGMAKFVIADITDPKSVPHELKAIIPHLPSVLVQPIIDEQHEEYALFEDFKAYPWVKPVINYSNSLDLIRKLHNESGLPW